MRIIFRASEALARIADGIGKLISWLAIPMMLAIMIDVVTRKYVEVDPGFVDSVLNIGSTKLQEAEWHLHSIMFLLTLGFVYTQDKQVRVELLREKFSPRTRAWIEVLGCLLFLIPYCAFLFWYGYTFTERSFDLGEGSSAQTGLPYRWAIKAMLPLGFLVLAAAGVSVLLRNIVYLFGPEDLRTQSGWFVEHDDMRELRRLAEEEIEEDLRRHPEHLLDRD